MRSCAPSVIGNDGADEEDVPPEKVDQMTVNQTTAS
jgi:hypothetical protein